LESALFLDPERSVSLVSREKREEDVEDPFTRAEGRGENTRQGRRRVGGG
jgi:hypothetical protein